MDAFVPALFGHCVPPAIQTKPHEQQTDHLSAFPGLGTLWPSQSNEMVGEYGRTGGSQCYHSIGSFRLDTLDPGKAEAPGDMRAILDHRDVSTERKHPGECILGRRCRSWVNRQSRKREVVVKANRPRRPTREGLTNQVLK